MWERTNKLLNPQTFCIAFECNAFKPEKKEPSRVTNGLSELDVNMFTAAASPSRMMRCFVEIDEVIN